MISLLARLLRILNSETEPAQISLAVCLAMVVGLTPFFNLHNLFVFFLVCVLRVNIPAFLLFLPLFSALAYLLDPIFHQIGWALLSADTFESFWTILYNNAFMRLTRFNNTIVMGSVLFSIFFFLPLFFFANYLIRRYRSTFMAWIQRTKIVQILRASRLYAIYRSVAGIGGAR